MNTVSYETGRNYGAPQVLVITAPDQSELDKLDCLDEVKVTFKDQARNLAGVVTLHAFRAWGSSLGPDVLLEYDSGRYEQVDL